MVKSEKQTDERSTCQGAVGLAVPGFSGTTKRQSEH